MRAPAFWSKPPSHPLARLLTPAGAAYGRLTAARMDRPGARAPCPVICIGNFTLGGAGKTPSAIRIARMLAESGARPAFLSRGYGGSLSGPIVVEPGRHGASAVGDEPLLLARHAPTIVARDRVAGASLCAAQGADVIVMDDGLQNPSLRKDFSLAVVDAGSGLGNGLPFPAGPLRAPLDRQWPHVGGLVLIGEGAAGEAVAQAATARGLAVHRARLVPEPHDLAGWRVVAFAGIGRPDKFFETLRGLGAEIAGTRGFPDHHRFAPAELTQLAALADRLDAALVTTEKDAVRLPPAFAATVKVLKVELRFEDAAPLSVRLAAVVDGCPTAPRRPP